MIKDLHPNIDFVNTLYSKGILQKLDTAGIVVFTLMRDRDIVNYVINEITVTNCSTRKACIMASAKYNLSLEHIRLMCKKLMDEDKLLPAASDHPPGCLLIGIVNHLADTGQLLKLVRIGLLNNGIFRHLEMYNMVFDLMAKGYDRQESINTTATKFKCSKSTIWTALRMLGQ